jgi:hypothetical protein
MSDQVASELFLILLYCNSYSKYAGHHDVIATVLLNPPGRSIIINLGSLYFVFTNSFAKVQIEQG